MKKILIISTVFALTFFAITKISAQNNLQFNKVVYFQCSGVGTVDTTITVPTNKTWKIESALASSNTPLCLDGDILYQLGANSIKFPVWLPQGSYTFSSIDSNQHSFSVSIIEFNIVP